jgi:endoglucanase
MLTFTLSARSALLVSFCACLTLLGCEDDGVPDEAAVGLGPFAEAGAPPSVTDGSDANAPMSSSDAASEAGEGEPQAGDAGGSDGSQPVDAAQGVVDAGGGDDIFGTQVARAEAWWVEGGRIHFGDREVRLYGLNWFGLETDARALFGPVEAQRSVADFLAQIKALGFNALRVPLSPESIDPGFEVASWARRGDLDTGREHFEELARAAKDAGLYMLWDIHTCSSAVGYRKTGPLDPACTGYGKQKWIENLQTLATLAKSYAPAVLGIDLFNEPHGLTWDAWKALAEEGGAAVLRENPHILTFVEGTAAEGYQDPDGVFWGENLSGVRQAPIALPAARLVYSPHVYGPSVYAQPYFSVDTFPTNMPAIWDKHFGYLFQEGAAVVPGEFGGRYTGSDKVWQDAFVDYLTQKAAPGFFYWSLNPNSDDTGGILLDDFKTVDPQKLALLKRLMQ